jgi:hypothetical protein
MKYCPITTPSLVIMHFRILECLIKESNLGTNSLSLPSTLEQTQHLTMFIFPSSPQTNSNQENLAAHCPDKPCSVPIRFSFVSSSLVH